MIVKTNTLLNYIRCRRFAALHDQNSDTDPNTYDKYYQKSMSKFKDIFLSLNYKESMVYEKDIEYTYDFHHEITLSENFDFIMNDKDIFILVTESSKDFLKLTYRETDQTYPLFKKNHHGHYTMVKEVQYSMNYGERVNRLKLKSELTGRVIYRYAFMHYLYQNVFPDKPFNIYMVLLNEDYVHNGLSFNDHLYHIFDFSNLDGLDNMIEIALFRMITHLELNDVTPCPLLQEACLVGKENACKFVGYCYAHLPEKNSILDYFDAHLGFKEPLKRTKIHHDTFELLNDGYVKMEDIPLDWLTDKNRLLQRYCLDNKIQYMNKEKIGLMLDGLKYPLTFLNLSLMPTIIPKFMGERPFEVLGFQYSIYYKKSDEIIGLHDERVINSFKETRTDTRDAFAKRFAEHLLKYDGHIIVYDKSRLLRVFRSIQQVFPNVKGQFEKIANRFVDILDILMIDKKYLSSLGRDDLDLNSYNFYDNRLSGHYSLSNLATVFDFDEMNQLKIHDDETEYKTFRLHNDYNDQSKQEMIDQMIAYSQHKAFLLVHMIQVLGMKIEF
jgi:hypothetical protein